MNKAVKFLSILINTLWTHRCSVLTKDLPVIKIRVSYLFSFLCSPIMRHYVLDSVLWFPHTKDVRFVFTSSCLYEDSCVIYIICACLHIVVCNTYCVVFLLWFTSWCMHTLCFLWIVHFWMPLRFYLNNLSYCILYKKNQCLIILNYA